jgi:hypothetical protein
MSELMELAAKCESATGPDRELDAEIFRAVYGADVWSYHDNCHIDYQIARGTWTKPREEHPDFEASFDDIITWSYRIGSGADAKHGDLPALTASIDAAMTLLDPAGEISISTLYGVARVEYPLNFSDHEPYYGEHVGRLIALAICAAALRTRADTAGVRGNG